MAVQALEVLMPFSPPSAAALVITGIGYETQPITSGYAIDSTRTAPSTLTSLPAARAGKQACQATGMANGVPEGPAVI